MRAAAALVVVTASIVLQGRVYAMESYSSGEPADSARAMAPGGGHWAFDPDYTGEQLPPTGHSLFDYLFTTSLDGEPAYRIPYPFSALRESIEVRLNPAHRGTSIRQVLIPHGRSLQRGLAAPDYFAFPRVVLAVDGEAGWQQGEAGMLLKDRLYIGYQEKANLLEVISYNEMAARFEFQVVHNYTQDNKPQVFYANRSVCLACHQNQAPVFSRPLWSETSANSQIARALQQTGKDFYSIKTEQGIDIPNAIDDATDRANLFAVTQALWRKGCGMNPDCRAHAFMQMLKYRLGGKQGIAVEPTDEQAEFTAAFDQNWEKYWPDGMAIPNPDIPNRDPLEADRTTGQAGQPRLDANIVASLDPLVPRLPLEIWSRKQAARKLITGLSAFLADTDIGRLDAFIYQTAQDSGVEVTTHSTSCELSARTSAKKVYRLSFSCPGAQGRVYVGHDRIQRGSIDRLGSNQDIPAISNLDITGGDIQRDGERMLIRLEVRNATLHARFANGNAIESIELSFDAPAFDDNIVGKKIPATLRVNELEDFALIHKAVVRLRESTAPDASMLFSDQAFQRSRWLRALFAELKMPALNWCCLSADRMPAAVQGAEVKDQATMSRGTSAFSSEEKRFFQYCASCHQSSDRFPPNFLRGSPGQVRAQLSHCAPRIQVRLKMWNYPPASRSKTPMPPFRAIHQQYPDLTLWQDSADLKSLQHYIDNLPGATGPVAAQGPQIDVDYESLRECLPAMLH